MNEHTRITLVIDGQNRWYAPEAELLEYLNEAPGWYRSSANAIGFACWREPADQDDPAEAYTALCEAIPGDAAQEWHSTFTWQESDDAWIFDPEDGGEPDTDPQWPSDE